MALEEAAMQFAIGMGGAGSGMGLGWWFMQRWMASTDERLKEIEGRQTTYQENCSTKMGKVYERMNQERHQLDVKIKAQEDCVEGELQKMNDKLGQVNLNVTKIITVMSMQAKRPDVQDILNSKIN